MPDCKKIGGALKEYFKSKGLTQQNIADELGVTQGAVTALLNGKPFGKRTATKWNQTFGINTIWLLTGEGEMLKKEPSDDSSHPPAPPGFEFRELVAMLKQQMDENKALREQQKEMMMAQAARIDDLLKMNQQLTQQLTQLLSDEQGKEKHQDTSQDRGRVLRP